MRYEESLPRVLCKRFRTFSAEVSDPRLEQTSSDTADNPKRFRSYNPARNAYFGFLTCLRTASNSLLIPTRLAPLATKAGIIPPVSV
jgi:hypothetical protein